jgi:hypothetical protein
MRQLPGRNAAEAAGSGALGQALHLLPGKDGTGAIVGTYLNSVTD